MGTAGIKKALIKDARQNAKPYYNSFLVELGHGQSSFTAYIDKSCLGPGTENPETTIKDVKWFLVREHVWSSYKRTYPKLSPSDFFTKLTTEEKDFKTFEGNNLLVDASTFNDGRVGDIGVIYLIIPYSVFPETDQTVPLQAVLLDKPQVLYCNFKFPKGGYIPLENNDKKATYGQTVEVEVYTHLLPDYRNGSDKFVFDVELINKGEAVAKLEKQEILNSELGAFDYNPTKILKFVIDPEWQKKHSNKKIDEKFYLRLKGNIGYTGPVVVASDYVAPSGDYDSEKQTSSWKRLERGKWVYDTSNELLVPFDTMSDLLSRYEVEKNNMIQYIGDIEYSVKENNPCAYSMITVNDGEKDIEIFNEYKPIKTVSDNTKRFVDIVAGDKEKKAVKVTAKFLESKESKPIAIKNGNACEMILNNGHKHSTLEDVFKMGWILGQWVPSQDPQVWMSNFLDKIKANISPNYYHPSNALSAPIIASAKAKPDQEAKGIPASKENQKKYESVTVAAIQGLTKDDYTINTADDSITLQLQYRYNKSYDNRILNYLYGEQEYFKKGALDDNYKNIWVVGYLLRWIKNDSLEQLYFVPVSTCRYPNQIAKIRVFPDMKWVFNFNYNIETPIYYKSTTALETYYSGFNEGRDITTANSSRRREIQDSNVTNILQPYVGRKTSFGLSVECEVNGEKDVFKLGKDFAEKYRKMIYPFLWMVNTLDNSFGLPEARNEEHRIRTSRNPGLLARLNKLPMSFELKPPSLGVGLGIGYASSKNGEITYELDGRIKANPIIGAEVKLDILALGSKFKPFGVIIDALDIVSWAANVLSGGHVEIDYKIEVRFTAEVKLIGKQISKDPKTNEKKYAPEAHLKYNLKDKKLHFEGGLQGIIKGEIEVSLKILIQAKAKNMNNQPLEDKKNKKAELSVGVQGSSYVSLSCPFELNEKGNLDVDFYFSGIKVEVWFRASYSSKNTDGDPDYSEKIIPHIDITKPIEF